MKFFEILKGVVKYITDHAFSAFAGFCFAVLNLGGMAYLFHDGRAFFGVVAIINLVILVLPFGYDCLMPLIGNTNQSDNDKSDKA